MRVQVTWETGSPRRQDWYRYTEVVATGQWTRDDYGPWIHTGVLVEVRCVHHDARDVAPLTHFGIDALIPLDEEATAFFAQLRLGGSIEV